MASFSTRDDQPEIFSTLSSIPLILETVESPSCAARYSKDLISLSFSC
jgi:hypothetical protein